MDARTNETERALTDAVHMAQAAVHTLATLRNVYTSARADMVARLATGRTDSPIALIREAHALAGLRDALEEAGGESMQPFEVRDDREEWIDAGPFTGAFRIAIDDGGDFDGRIMRAERPFASRY